MWLASLTSWILTFMSSLKAVTTHPLPLSFLMILAEQERHMYTVYFIILWWSTLAPICTQRILSCWIYINIIWHTKCTINKFFPHIPHGLSTRPCIILTSIIYPFTHSQLPSPLCFHSVTTVTSSVTSSVLTQTCNLSFVLSPPLCCSQLPSPLHSAKAILWFIVDFIHCLLKKGPYAQHVGVGVPGELESFESSFLFWLNSSVYLAAVLVMQMKH